MTELTANEALMRIRKKKGLSQAALARKAGLNGVTVNQIELGRLVPYESQLFKIAEALDVPTSRARELLLAGSVSESAPGTECDVRGE